MSDKEHIETLQKIVKIQEQIIANNKEIIDIQNKQINWFENQLISTMETVEEFLLQDKEPDFNLT